jgi:hypothetical protein
MAELDPGVRELLEAIRGVLRTPMPDPESDQGAYAKELENRVRLVDHAVGRVLCEEPKAMADFVADLPKCSVLEVRARLQLRPWCVSSGL